MEGLHSWGEAWWRDPCPEEGHLRSLGRSEVGVLQWSACGSAVGGRHGQAQGVGETRLALGGTHVAGVVQQVVGDGQDR